MSVANLPFLVVLFVTTFALMVLEKAGGGHLIALNQSIKLGTWLLLGAPLFAFVVLWAWRRGRIRRVPRGVWGGVAVVLVAWLLSTFNALDPEHAFIAGYRLYLIPLGVLLLGLILRPSEREILWLFGGLALLGLLFALVGIAQHFGWHEWAARLPRIGAGSLLYSQNFAGELVALLIAPALVFALSLKRPWVRRLLLGVPLIMLAHLVLTEGRAAWVALLVAFVLVGAVDLLRRRRLRRAGGEGEGGPNGGVALLAVPALFIALILASPYWSSAGWWQSPLQFEPRDSRYVDELGSIRADKSSGRVELWRDSLRLLRHESGVVGAGVEHYRLLYPKYMDASRFLFHLHWKKKRFNTAKYAHNDYIQLVADIGVLGLLGVVAIGLLALWSALRALYRARSSEARLVALALSVTTVLFAVNMLLDFPSRIAPVVMSAWFLMGLALSRGGGAEAAVAERTHTGVGTGVGAGLLALLFIGGGVIGWMALSAEYAAARGEIELRAKRMESAEHWYRRALSREPWDERFLTKFSWLASRRGGCAAATEVMERAGRRNPYLLPVLLNGLHACRGERSVVIDNARDIVVTYYADIPEGRRWRERPGSFR